MKAKHVSLLVSGLSIIGAAAIAWIMVDPIKPQNKGVFPQAGYRTLVPYVDQLVPGLFDTVENETEHSVSLHPTCELSPSDVETLIRTKATVHEVISQTLSAGYDADIKVLPGGLGLDLSTVQSVKVRYMNSRTWYLTAEGVLEVREKFLRGSCEAAILSELRKGYRVCQPKSVIVSDVVYEVTYRSGAKAEVRAPAKDSIRAGGESESGHTISGERMYHAVKLDESCLVLNPEAETS